MPSIILNYAQRFVKELTKMARNNHNLTIRLTLTALFMAMNIVMSLSLFSIPVPGGHLYLCDAVIVLASILLNPWEAFIVGGVGSFLGDLMFYPVAMYVSLVAHGLQAVAISVISHYTLKKHPRIASGIGAVIGAAIMVTGYTLGKIYVYSTFEYAMMKLPYEILQGLLGVIVGFALCWHFGIHKAFNRILQREA